MSYVSTSNDVTEPRFGHAWRAKDDSMYATVYLSTRNSSSVLTFDSAANARALAAACTEAAEAIDRIAAEGGSSS